MKLGVCVPYRNREAHLNEFVPRVGKYLESQGIEYHMYFGHQVDDKLFNRGATKNIAAKHAFEDGCDYVVWHDIDMIPEEGGGADYSFPTDNPRHIATQISQMNYELKYEEYFGGAVLFSKEQVENTNGYSNDYWDWGMEDDDLFWRCNLEGYLNSTNLKLDNENRDFLRFDGIDSFVEIPTTRTLRNITSRSHSVSVLVRAQQQEDKVPIWLVGDEERQFVEFPILRRPGYDYGLSYNNSRAYTLQLWNNHKDHLYQWMKRYENKWSWITFVIDDNKVHFYMNGTESDARWGTGTNSPLEFNGSLKRYGNVPYYLGTTPSVPNDNIQRWFKGDIADVKMWNRALSKDEINNIANNPTTDGLVLHYDFKDGLAKDKTDNGNDGEVFSCNHITDTIQIPNSVIPHRSNGKMFCLPHIDEGLIEGDGGVMKWAKGETTAANERKYVLRMQQGKWDYKSDGIAQLKYTLVGKDEISPKATMLNITL